MSGITEDEGRENRIYMEVVVDAYGEEERAMGWYYYLKDKLQFPFRASTTALNSPRATLDFAQVDAGPA